MTRFRVVAHSPRSVPPPRGFFRSPLPPSTPFSLSRVRSSISLMELKLSNPASPSPFPFEGKLLKPSIPRLFGFPTATSRGRPNFGSLVSSSPGMKLHSIQGSAKTVGLEKGRMDQSEMLTLDGIRHSLIRQEDTITFSLLERAQFRYNADTYNHNEFHMDGFDGSLVEFMVKETEKLNAQVGRYESPDEHPFFPEDLPEPMLPPIQYPKVLHRVAHTININKKIWDMYFNNLLPRLVKEGNDGNCGSSAVCDKYIYNLM